MSARRSWRMAGRRPRVSRARARPGPDPGARSATRRLRPSRLRPSRRERSTPRRAVRGRDGPRPALGAAAAVVQQRWWSWALSAWSLLGRQRGRPRPRRTPGTAASTTSSPAASTTSRTAASRGLVVAVGAARPEARRRAARGRDAVAPAQPGRPRSVGFGPISVAGDERPLRPGRTRPVDRGPVPVGRLRRGRPLPEHPVRIAQHARGVPAPQPAPAGPAPRTPDPDPGGSRPRGRTPPAAAAPGRRPTASHEPRAPSPEPRAPSTMPSRVPRSQHRGRPPFGFGGSGGQPRPDRRPRPVAHKRSGHGPPTPHAQMGSVGGSKAAAVPPRQARTFRRGSRWERSERA